VVGKVSAERNIFQWIIVQFAAFRPRYGETPGSYHFVLNFVVTNKQTNFGAAKNAAEFYKQMLVKHGQ